MARNGAWLDWECPLTLLLMSCFLALLAWRKTNLLLDSSMLGKKGDDWPEDDEGELGEGDRGVVAGVV